MDELTRTTYELRSDIIDEVYQSKAGHVGGDLSVIDILTVLYYQVMDITPENFSEAEPGPFSVEQGTLRGCPVHGAGRSGIPLTRRRPRRPFPPMAPRYIGHPNTRCRESRSIRVLSDTVGSGRRHGAGRKDGRHGLPDLCGAGSGEMAEGSNYEAMMAAGQYHLNNLCVTVDLNGLQISGTHRRGHEHCGSGKEI